ncbi:hypothetical protein PXK58_18845 [Phaeobacter gallaeciensis]|uniref:hypothetical protein n=1 Tax=Phaeobacter gallaeciensis TaxID=60890 RepID=UPI00238032D0|nr:hypothetical protein [Phaeobacter gallaeciensis]MDE4276403.1 hypothetical protein [Phaeobacter gallaeciensis]MDE4301618.1 hypothetical protein [Phaeobacter gallaeciensis]MDE5186773.1 hypothetical protein [Phaeobacter gallaeciensis]
MTQTAGAKGANPKGGAGKPAWRVLLRKARAGLYAPADNNSVAALRDELQAFRNSGENGSKRPEIRAMQTLADWHLSGEIKTTYRNLNEARVQIWEYEYFCPVFAFQKAFLEQVVRDYPNAPGPSQFNQVCAYIGTPVDDARDDRSKDVVVFRRPGATRTVLGVSGQKGVISGMGWTMFDRAVTQKLNANLIILRDANHLFCLNGIKSLGTLDETIAGLRDLLTEFQDTRIIATGGSAGVLGALYLSCELGIDHVIASSGPTSLDIGVDEGDRQRYLVLKEMAAKGKVPYPDLAAKVAASGIRRVDFFVAGQHEFDMRQMRNLADRTDVVTPHIYEDEANHSIIARTILDGSFTKAVTQDV